VPKSRLRRKSFFTPPKERSAAVRIGSPRWLVPLMLFFFLAGLVWLVTWYITEQRYPVEALGAWNMGVGFGLVLIGFGLATRWK
jgi:hypothetical protein